MVNKITILRILIVIGIAKVTILLVLTFFNNPQVQYNIKPIEKSETQKIQLLGSESLSPVDPTLTPPRVVKTEEHSNSITHLYGTGQAGSIVILYVTQISSPRQAEIRHGISLYTTTVSADGSWKIEDNENDFLLPPGTYNGTIFAYYPELNKKSSTSDSFSFSVRESTFSKFISMADTVTTALILIVLCIELVLFVTKHKFSFRN